MKFFRRWRRRFDNWCGRLADDLSATRGRNPAWMTEIVIFRTDEDARAAGFRGAAYPDMPWIRAWWPGMGVEGLMMRPLRRVTIPSHMLRHETSEGNLVAILRSRQMAFGDQAIWIMI